MIKWVEVIVLKLRNYIFLLDRKKSFLKLNYKLLFGCQTCKSSVKRPTSVNQNQNQNPNVNSNYYAPYYFNAVWFQIENNNQNNNHSNQRKQSAFNSIKSNETNFNFYKTVALDSERADERRPTLIGDKHRHFASKLARSIGVDLKTNKITSCFNGAVSEF